MPTITYEEFETQWLSEIRDDEKDFTPLLVDAIKIDKKSLNTTGNANIIGSLLKDI